MSKFLDKLDVSLGVLFETGYAHVMQPTINVQDIAIFYALRLVPVNEFSMFQDVIGNIAQKLYQSLRAAILSKVMIKFGMLGHNPLEKPYDEHKIDWDTYYIGREEAKKRTYFLQQAQQSNDWSEIRPLLDKVSDEELYNAYVIYRNQSFVHNPWQNIVETFYRVKRDLLSGNVGSQYSACEICFQLIHGQLGENTPGDILDHIFTSKGTKKEFRIALDLKRGGDMMKLWRYVPESIRIRINKVRRSLGQNIIAVNSEEPEPVDIIYDRDRQFAKEPDNG
jgi:hypothetical protein